MLGLTCFLLSTSVHAVCGNLYMYAEADDCFMCDDGECIDRAWQCDGFLSDCENAEDEMGCATCAFKCDNGACLQNASWICDGVNDCDSATWATDLSDELNCPTDPPAPTANDCFMCNDSLCINRARQCDGTYEDCPNGEDEIGCDTCAFVCDNGACLQNAAWICDGVHDCVNAGTGTGLTDESNCPTAPPPTQVGDCFMCDDGECIERAWQCDGKFEDCDNAEDENGCDTCAFVCDNGACLQNAAWVCDGIFDCHVAGDLDGDKSDESNCSTAPPPTQVGDCFMCDDGECIERAWQCDGKFEDCDNGEDENGCDSCAFKCDNGACLQNRAWVCDGKYDCNSAGDNDGDISDERNCALIRRIYKLTGKVQRHMFSLNFPKHLSSFKFKVVDKCCPGITGVCTVHCKAQRTRYSHSSTDECIKATKICKGRKCKCEFSSIALPF